MATHIALLGLLPSILAFDDLITSLPTYGPIKIPQVVFFPEFRVPGVCAGACACAGRPLLV